MRKGMRRGALSLVAGGVLATGISACTTTFDLGLSNRFGTAIDGDFVATTWNAIDNECQPVSTLDSTLTLAAVPSAEWSREGRRVLLQQVSGSFTETGPANATSDPGIAGAWEIVPVASVEGTAVTAAVPLSRAYSSGATKAAQACLVREYGVLSLETSLRPAAAWSGSAGGVLVFFVREVLHATTLDALSAAGAGFPGGLESGDLNNAGAVAWDTDAVDGGFKGHGIDHRSRLRNGRGSYRNGAGSGNAERGAGGGGAGYGDGGNGEAGLTDSSGGFGGVAPEFLDEDFTPGRLFFGGGGGGGHASINTTAGTGGFGGGLILGGAQRVDGELTLLADGLNGKPPVTGRGGGGGGGGGGGVVVFWTEGTSVVACRARGGAGAGGSGQGGRGGSGGGGACWVDGEANVSVVNSTSGEAGIHESPGEIPDWWNE